MVGEATGKVEDLSGFSGFFRRVECAE